MMFVAETPMLPTGSLAMRGRKRARSPAAGRQKTNMRKASALAMLQTIPEDAQITFSLWNPSNGAAEVAQTASDFAAAAATPRTGDAWLAKSRRRQRRTVSKRELADQIAMARRYIGKLRTESEEDETIAELLLKMVIFVFVLFALVVASAP